MVGFLAVEEMRRFGFVNPSIMAWKPFFAYPNSANPSQFNPIQRRIVGYTHKKGV